MPTSKVHPGRSVVPAATASKSTKASAEKPATYMPDGTAAPLRYGGSPL